MDIRESVLDLIREYDMLAGADLAVVVVGDEERSDTWTEDCSVVMENMHLMASVLGVGSCWIQIRLRKDRTHHDVKKHLTIYRINVNMSVTGKYCYNCILKRH